MVFLCLAMASGVNLRLILGSVVQVLGVLGGSLVQILDSWVPAGDRHVSILYSDQVRFASLKYLKLMLRHFKLAEPQSPSPEKFSENATIKAMEDQHHHGPQAQAHDWRWTIPNLLVYMETLTKLWLCRAVYMLFCIDWSCHLDQWTMWTCMRGSRGGRWGWSPTWGEGPPRLGQWRPGWSTCRLGWSGEYGDSWLENTTLIEIESLFIQMWTPPFEWTT